MPPSQSSGIVVRCLQLLGRLSACVFTEIATTIRLCLVPVLLAVRGRSEMVLKRSMPCRTELLFTAASIGLPCSSCQLSSGAGLPWLMHCRTI